MRSTVDALERLQHAVRNVEGVLGEPLDVARQLEPMAMWLESAEASLGGSVQSPPAGAVQDAVARWHRSGGSLARISDRDVRLLCGEPTVATSLAFVRSLREESKTLVRRQWIERLANSYFSEWRRMEQPALVEQLLRQAVTHPGNRSRLLRRWAPEAWNLFSEKAAQWLGRSIVDRGLPPGDLLDLWGIEKESRLGVAAVRAAIDEWAERFRRVNEDWRPSGIGTAGELYQQLVDYLLPSPVLERGAVASAVSDVILWPHIHSSEPVMAHIRQLLLKDGRFGDPRLDKNKANWALMKDGARRRALSWLAKEDLLFFFEFVIREDPHGRKDFWLQYIEQVEDSNVALCDEDVYRLKASTRASERLSYWAVVGAGGVSAFLMKFRGAQGLVFVEFSKPNNALYVHDADTFEQHVGGLRPMSGHWPKAFHLSHDLKHHLKLDKQSHHVSTWREKVSERLLRLGVRRDGI